MKNNKFVLSIYFFIAFCSLVSISTAQAAICTYTVTNDWGSGFTAAIRITNNSSSTISTWQVSWNYTDGSRRTDGWNATVTGNNPYTATPLSWNANIAPNASVEFGVQGTNGSSRAQVPAVTGAICSSSTPSSARSSIRSSVRSSIRSSVASSVRSSARSSVRSSINSSLRSSSSNSSVASIAGGCDGYATRYWDCCKAHCGWSANVPSSITAMKSCAINNTVLNDLDLQSSCNGGPANMCWSATPFTVNANLAYGYAATQSGDVCGRCYQLQFTGESFNAPGDPGSTALRGKTMIVQATNIGHDVSGGQFDILVPGGGVGAFNACSSQWGVSNAELGAQYGGLLAACKQEFNHNGTLAQYKTCLKNRCDSVFGSRGLTDLQRGCNWYVDWFEAADNPKLKYKEVACPSELISRSGLNRSGLNDIRNNCN
jgi:Glycosyl hydrolase family 45/Cellulose binding domain